MRNLLKNHFRMLVQVGRARERRGDPGRAKEIQCNFLVKKLVSEACHVVARCLQHPLPTMVACSHDEAFIKNYSRGENSTISWIRSVDFIANPISTRFYGSNGIVSLRLNEERRSSSAVETVCRPWTASPARTHPVEECTTRKRSRNGVSCVGAASCGPFAAWRNAAAPFQLTSPTISTPLISPHTIITPRFLRIDCLLRAMGRRRPRPRVLVLPFKGFWRLGSDFDGCVSTVWRF